MRASSINRFKCYLIKNNLREYEPQNAYWKVNDLKKFNKIMVHQKDDNLKYLSCLSCQSAILGYQVIGHPDQIFIACDRVKLENERDGEEGAEADAEYARSGEDYMAQQEQQYTQEEMERLEAMAQQEGYPQGYGEEEAGIEDEEEMD